MSETELLDALSIDSMEDLHEGIENVEDFEGDALEALLFLAESDDEIVLMTLAEKLGEATEDDDERIIDTLQALTHHESPMVRESAVQSLAWVSPDQALPRALAMLKDDSEGMVRAGAAEALGFTQAKEALEPLKTAMSDPDSTVRAFAAASIGEIGEPDLLPFLAEQLEQQTAPETRVEIMGAQWRLGRVEALDELAGVLRRASSDLIPNIFNVLEELLARPGYTEALMKDHSTQLAKVLRLVEEADAIHGTHARIILDKIVAS